MKHLVLDVLIKRKLLRNGQNLTVAVIKEVKPFRNLKGLLSLKESFTLKEDHRIIGLGNPTALFAKSLATGHLSVLCGQRPKSK
jgi:hypothetical protein